jgi:RND superfamily putative drug exporter
MFDLLGRCVGRWWWVFLILWPALALGLALCTPRLSDVLVEDQARFLPASADSVQARRVLEEGFPADRTRSTAVIVVANPQGLSAEDYGYVADLSRWLRSSEAPKCVIDVLSVPSAPFLRGKLDSQDGKATLLVVDFDTLFATSATQRAVESIRQHLDDAPARLTVRMTGEAALGRDYGFAASESLNRTTVATVVLVLTILILVYRSPIAPLVPLAAVAVALVIAKALLAFMAWAGVDILPITEIILVVVLFGAGTDYCLFLVSRYREELIRLRGGATGAGDLDPEAVAGEGGRKSRLYAQAARLALASVGKAITSSSATDIIGLALMWFASFRGFRTSGPAIALGLGVMLLAALTFAPSVAILLGRALDWRPWQAADRRLAEGVRAVGSRVPAERAGSASTGSAQKGDRPAAVGDTGVWPWVADVVTRRPGRVLVLALVCFAPFALLGLVAEPSYDLFAELPGRAESVQGYKLLGQHFGTGEAFPLTVVLSRPREGAPSLGVLPPVSEDHEEPRRPVAEGPRPVTRDFWTADSRGKVVELSKKLEQFGLVSEVRSAVRPLGHPGDLGYLLAESRPLVAMSDRLARLLGLGTGAAGAAGAVEGGDLEAVALQLSRADIERLIPLRQALSFYISPDGRVTRLDLLLREPGYSRAATDFVELLKRRLPAILREVGLAETTVHFAGATAVINDIKQVTHRDFYRVMVLVVVGVGLILVPTLRELAAPVYLMATMVLNYLATMGVAFLVFVVGAGHSGLDWKVQFFMFVLLVSVGIDYNIFIMTRIQEEKARRGLLAGVREAVVRTGGVISSCGVIMAGAFASMLLGSLAVVVQLGFAVAVGMLLDTFIVRPIVVPAIVLLWEGGAGGRGRT